METFSQLLRGTSRNGAQWETCVFVRVKGAGAEGCTQVGGRDARSAKGCVRIDGAVSRVYLGLARSQGESYSLSLSPSRSLSLPLLPLVAIIMRQRNSGVRSWPAESAQREFNAYRVQAGERGARGAREYGSRRSILMCDGAEYKKVAASAECRKSIVARLVTRK